MDPVHIVVAAYAVVSFGAFAALVYLVLRAARRQGQSLRPALVVAGVCAAVAVAIWAGRRAWG